MRMVSRRRPGGSVRGVHRSGAPNANPTPPTLSKKASRAKS
jgi:hypothetical protein